MLGGFYFFYLFFNHYSILDIVTVTQLLMFHNLIHVKCKCINKVFPRKELKKTFQKSSQIINLTFKFQPKSTIPVDFWILFYQISISHIIKIIKLRLDKTLYFTIGQNVFFCIFEFLRIFKYIFI